MAISKMTKFIIATHRSEATELLETLQSSGLVEILDAERAMITKQWPELHIETKRSKDLEELVSRLGDGIAFLKSHFKGKESTTLLCPKTVVSPANYDAIVADKNTLEVLEKSEYLDQKIGSLRDDINHYGNVIRSLEPWTSFTEPVESMRELESATCFAGIAGEQKFDEMTEKLVELGAVIDVVGTSGKFKSAVVACLNDASSEVSKVLRAYDFENANFEGMSGTISEIIKDHTDKLSAAEKSLAEKISQAEGLSEHKNVLELVYDHYYNIAVREQTLATVPETDHAVLFEGWGKSKDFKQVEKLVGGFAASSISEMELAEGEVAPVEIDNGGIVQPFETITRLYGMPAPKDVDPTVFLAPFFAIFFGLCMTDAGYGIVLAIILALVLKKVQGNNKGALWMLFICSITTIIAGALTGGWFADTFQTLLPESMSGLNTFREKIMLFDPMTDPMPFFRLSLGLGYLQIIFGLCIAFYNSLRNKDYASAICNHLSWILFLNSLVLYAFSKNGTISFGPANLYGIIALIQVVVIFLFTERSSGLAGRIGGGTFALFSTVFYLGDVLSYVRLMALGMVAAGLGIAVNILVKLVMEVPYVGFILGAILFVGGHMFNLVMGLLGSFVHSLRLQFVEFFPKFLAGGGRDFKPIKKEYKHVSVEQ